MKQIAPFIAFISLVLFSCSKEYSVEFVPATLQGTWRMIAVKDNNSGLISTRPSDVPGDVVITFTATGNISGVLVGNTPTNSISQSDYITDVNQMLTIQSLNITKLWETPWGNEFVNNIRSSYDYSFESDGKLVIWTTNATLIFDRL